MERTTRYRKPLHTLLADGPVFVLCCAVAVCTFCGSCWAQFAFESQTYDLPGGSRALRGCRLDGPEKDDLAILRFHTPLHAEWLTDFPASLPGSGTHFEAEGGGQDILAADLDADGLDDLAVLAGEFYGPGEPEHFGIYVLINAGSGELQQESFLPIYTVSFTARKLAAADIDGDGALELLLFNTQHEYVDPVTGPPPWGSVVFFDRADETGFSYSGYVGTCGSGFDFAVMDFNGDEYADVVTLSDTSDWMTERIEVFAGGPGPSLSGPVAEVTIPDLFVKSLAVVPFDDGDVLVVGAPNRDAVGNDQVGGLLFYAPSGATLELVHTTSANLSVPLMEDLNLDGSPEMICITVNDSTEGLEIFTDVGGGGGVFTDWSGQFVPLEEAMTGLTTGDFSGDGYPDILVSFHVGSGNYKLVLLTQVPGGAGVPVCTVLLAVFGVAAICLVALYLIRNRATAA